MSRLVRLVLLVLLVAAPAPALAQGSLGTPLTSEPPVPFARGDDGEAAAPESEPEGNELANTGGAAALLGLLGAGLVASGAGLRLHLRLLGD